jgi:hypothetical protein
MTRKPWRLHAAGAPFPFRHLFALPSLKKSDPYTTKKPHPTHPFSPTHSAEDPGKREDNISDVPLSALETRAVMGDALLVLTSENFSEQAGLALPETVGFGCASS